MLISGRQKKVLQLSFEKRMCEKFSFQKVSDVLTITIRRYWLIHEGTGSVRGKYWLVRGGTGSVWGGTGWYLVRRGQCWLIYDGTGSIWSRTG